MKAIHKDYHVGNMKVHALDGIDITVERGEFVSIVGPSGSGKSTLMSILGCLDIADSGSYFLNGIDVTHMNDDTLTHTRNRMLGFVFQNFNLLPRTTALENVETPLIYAGMKKKQRHDKARAMLERVGLADRAHHTTNQLSGGQQQRVAIARALINTPKLLLADEPTGNLDSTTSDNIMSFLEEINADDEVTVLLITHEAEVASRTHRRLSLRDGKLLNHP
jgi:putative ABC transport system ATP-binding protein